MMNNTRHELPIAVELDFATTVVEWLTEAEATIVVEEDVVAWLGRELADRIDFEVVELHGPTSWPVVRITGRPADVRTIVDRYDEEANA